MKQSVKNKNKKDCGAVKMKEIINPRGSDELDIVKLLQCWQTCSKQMGGVFSINRPGYYSPGQPQNRRASTASNHSRHKHTDIRTPV